MLKLFSGGLKKKQICVIVVDKLLAFFKLGFISANCWEKCKSNVAAAAAVAPAAGLFPV